MSDYSKNLSGKVAKIRWVMSAAVMLALIAATALQLGSGRIRPGLRNDFMCQTEDRVPLNARPTFQQWVGTLALLQSCYPTSR